MAATTHRRRFLKLAGAVAAGAAAGPLILGSRRTWADDGKIQKIEKNALGTTVWLSMEKGMFPDRGSKYRDDTTIVFIPKHYVSWDREDFKLDTVLHFHGHRTTAEKEMRRKKLREQLAASRQNAVLVMPQGPVNANDSAGGKLEGKDGLLDFLAEFRKLVQHPKVNEALGRGAIDPRARVGELCISAHSGGYLVASHCLEQSRFPVREVYLFDALYGRREVFFDWVRATTSNRMRERHKLVSYYSRGTPLEQSQKLLDMMVDAGVGNVEVEEKEGDCSRAELMNARAVFIKTNVDHGRLVSQNWSLRDCLYASALKRHPSVGGDSWHNTGFGEKTTSSHVCKNGPNRKIDKLR